MSGLTKPLGYPPMKPFWNMQTLNMTLSVPKGEPLAADQVDFKDSAKHFLEEICHWDRPLDFWATIRSPHIGGHPVVTKCP
ncbi:hypothetical protein GDO81_021570 [Engystomops pustulosus]|uniref:Uncharacterized protein n=1 Tax=Engystomops pustulosus TaxID=76066 RepID=A0AAV6Z9V2_ENGPU|nr:hypothetical protein GDO81_021570 [Engystomops pustulosus]